MLTTPSSHRPASPRRRGRRRGEEMLAPPAFVDVDVTDSPHPPHLTEGMPQHPGWARVEPWNALLCGGAGAGTEEDGAAMAARRRAEELQDRKLAKAVPREHEKIAIPQDVRRTRSDTAAFHGEEAKDWLQRCVALFCQERGLQYTQGLTELAAPWALITDPPSLSGFSYRCFCSFVDRFAPNIFTTAPDKAPTQEGQGAFVVLEVHLVVLEQLLRYHDPPLAAHLEDCCISAGAYATSWFVTLFARQTPVPVLLHLWQRLIEYGDPVLHQFLALAWLVSNRLVLLETSRDEVPATITRLKMKSEDTVDGVFGAALALRRLTPRRVCHVLREACYGGGEGGAPVEREVSRQRVTVSVSMLEGLRTAGIVMVDAAQVADIILASSPTGTAGKGGGSRGGGEAAESKEGLSWGAAGNGGRFVLLDCRPQGSPAPTAATFSGTAEMEAAIEARGKGTERGGVIWRRIKPEDYLGEKSTALAELLREVSAPAVGVRAEEGRELSDIGRLVGLEASGQRSVDKHAAAAAAAGNGSSNASTAPCRGNAGCGGGGGGGGGGAATHVCFVGTGKREGKGGSGRTYGAAVASVGPPECRLALAASRSCLTSHVCVLEGGFPALEAALRKRSSERGNAPLKSGAITALVSGSAVDAPASSALPQEGVGSDASRVGAGAESFPRPGSEGIDLCDAAYVAVTGVSVVGQPEVGAAATAAAAAAGGSPSRESSQSYPLKTATSGSLTPGGTRNASEESGVPLPPPLVTTPVQTLERKMSRPASSSKISESFRAYAAKGADEMGRGLRSLPLTASRPLEDAARVCNSLAKANVKVLGDGHMALSRSISRLEQLDARMSGTARGFARNFGGGLHRK